MNKSVDNKQVRLTQAQRTEASDQRMFEAAVEMINARGAAATSLSDVGIQAGYSRGLASHRFGNKENLFVYVVRQVGERWLAQLKKSIGSSIGLEAIEKALDQHYIFCVDTPVYVRTLYLLWFESINSESELAETINNIHERRYQDVVTWIIQDPSIDDRVKAEAEVIAAQFSASVTGIVYYWLANPTKLNEIKRMHDGLKRTMRQYLLPA